jgi:hypothetical protein
VGEEEEPVERQEGSLDTRGVSSVEKTAGGLTYNTVGDTGGEDVSALKLIELGDAAVEAKRAGLAHQAALGIDVRPLLFIIECVPEGSSDAENPRQQGKQPTKPCAASARYRPSVA